MKSSKKLWFRAKSYGWGWTPASWQGWLIVLIYIMLMAGVTSGVNIYYNFAWQAPVVSILIGFILTGILLVITYKTGEPPSWRWGRTKSKSSDNQSVGSDDKTVK